MCISSFSHLVVSRCVNKQKHKKQTPLTAIIKIVRLKWKPDTVIYGDSVLTALLKGPQGAVLLQCTFSANSLQVILRKGKIIAYIASLTRI